MRSVSTLPRLLRDCIILVAATLVSLSAFAQPAASPKRPMTFMDIMEMRSVGSPAISSDGKWMLYTMNTADWKQGRRFTDIWLVSMERGAETGRQMTFTKDKDETSPRWSRDGKFFLFLSSRDAVATAAGQNQIYLMRPDGGEARKITEVKDGVSNFQLTRDGKWLIFSAGKPEEQQLWAMSIATIETEGAKQLSKHATPIGEWRIAYDSKRVYFLAPETFDKDNRDRREKRFDVRIRNEETPINHLWAIEVDSKKESRLTSGTEYSVSNVTLSRDSRWVGFRGGSMNRYERNILEASTYSDLYLLDTSNGKIERLTNNKETGESSVSFSPDSATIAFSATNNFEYFRDSRVYVRKIADAGGQWRKLGENYDGDVSVGFWSNDSKAIYFNDGIRATLNLCSIDVAGGNVEQVTKGRAVTSVNQDEDTQKILINYSDPIAPSNFYTVASLDRVTDRSAWKRLTDSNPQVSGFQLGETDTVEWKSTDGRMVEGVLVKPVGYEKGKRYPLIVQIHGGPAAADLLSFSGSHGNYSNIYAAAGYICLLPNYRGSSNYGEKFRMETSGDYFRQGFEDIMAGVDHLISIGLVDPEKLGVMGWSAGGHYSNWILTHTDRFEAISSGAGAMNWLSMYAQNDTQRVREHYFKGQPYENWDNYWNVSPLKYIKNAKTPTLIHVVDGDPRVPRPQSEELHMALKKLGVPTEFFVYPGATHGIPDARNQYVKMVAEFNWFEKWIRGKKGWFEWKDILATLKDEQAPAEKKEGAETPKDLP